MAGRGKEWLTSERVAKEQPGIRGEERVEEMRGGRGGGWNSLSWLFHPAVDVEERLEFRVNLP